jgi:DNA-binding Lrp family transcriptional regulator
MDDIDGKILAELQENGRLTVTELADRVQLTPAPCHRRLRELERAGVITGYRAVVDPAAVGLGFEAIVSVTLERGDAATVAAFEAAVAAVPQIRHAERLFGDPDYLLRVVAADLNDYAALRDQELATLPGILRITSTIVMKRIVDNRPLPQPRTRPRRTVKGVLSGDGRPACRAATDACQSMSIAQSTMLFAGRLRNRHALAGVGRGARRRAPIAG